MTYEALIELPAGSKVVFSGVEYIRVRDDVANHLEDYFLSAATGELIHACLLPHDGYRDN